jgi:Rps23 Pro-64 3,4-dihydroxylase Tpa1-like proline 4-hydroxylase
MLSQIVKSQFRLKSLKPTYLRSFSSPPTLSTNLIDTLNSITPTLASSLHDNGYWISSTPLLSQPDIHKMREESIYLRSHGRFEQSYSEAIDASGKATRFDKAGVFACEPDGGDYDVAPTLLHYMSTIITQLPPMLNDNWDAQTDYSISNAAFNAKLAVTSSGGSGYPLHIDNPQGLTVGDTRKLTFILYLNPSHSPSQGGDLVLHLRDGVKVSVPPAGGSAVAFWSDCIPHSVMETSKEMEGEEYDRYAITIWLPTDDIRMIHDPASPFAGLKLD